MAQLARIRKRFGSTFLACPWTILILIAPVRSSLAMPFSRLFLDLPDASADKGRHVCTARPHSSCKLLLMFGERPASGLERHLASSACRRLRDLTEGRKYFHDPRKLLSHQRLDSPPKRALPVHSRPGTSVQDEQRAHHRQTRTLARCLRCGLSRSSFMMSDESLSFMPRKARIIASARNETVDPLPRPTGSGTMRRGRNYCIWAHKILEHVGRRP